MSTRKSVYKNTRKRKPGISELLLVVAAAAIMVTTSVIFITSSGAREEHPESSAASGNEPASPAGAEAGLGNGSASGTEPESGVDIISAPAVDVNTTQTPVNSPSDKITVIELAEKNAELLMPLDEESRSHNAMGVSLIIYDGYEGLYYTYNYGYAERTPERPVGTDTKFRIASLSKLVVVMCAMKLVDDGKLDIDEDISEYLGYNVRNPGYTGTPITSRMLMQHTSSIYDSEAFTESLMGRERRTTQSLLSSSSSYSGSRPGSSHLYTNFGYSILGAVVEHASGKKLDAFVRENLFGPLDIDAAFQAVNLTDTSRIAVLFDAGHGVTRSVEAQIANNRSGDLGQDQHIAQGGLIISALDYAKILAMLGNGGVFRNERILSPDAVTEIHKANVEGPGFKQGLSSRQTGGGSVDFNLLEAIEDDTIWRYINLNDEIVPSDGFYWHTGSAYGVYAQYIYIAGSGTDEGIGDKNTSRGVVVITTGARSGRAENGMVDICMHLSSIAWRGLGFNKH